MPVVVVDTITRPEHLVEYLAEFIESSDLPFAHVCKYNDYLIPEYPAVLIMAGTFNKELHGTHTFAVSIRADIYVYHAKLTEEYQTRTLSDMELATSLVELLEPSSLDLGGRVIAGWVESETPGVSPPRVRKSEAVICTRLSFQAIQETRFK